MLGNAAAAGSLGMPGDWSELSLLIFPLITKRNRQENNS
jgi:hypothetical protein